MLEQIVYEARPFAFIGTAVSAHMYAPNAFTNLFAFILVTCVTFVLYWRFENRFKLASPSRRRTGRK